jgi:uncharacterized protein
VTIDGYATIGLDREYDLTAGGLLESMDRAGVDRAVIAPVDRSMAVHNREGNDFVLGAAAEHPERFIASCSVNPWYGSEALAEFRRSVSEGARLLVLHPFLQGFVANDELVFPLLDAAADERVPVYFHTGPPGSATPWQLASLAVRFPALDFIMGHCGATDFWNDVVQAASSCPNLYIEASLARPFNFVVHASKLDPARALMGSAAPLNDLEFEWEQMKKFAPPDLWAAIAGGNLRRLLEKRSAL